MNLEEAKKFKEDYINSLVDITMECIYDSIKKAITNGNRLTGFVIEGMYKDEYEVCGGNTKYATNLTTLNILDILGNLYHGGYNIEILLSAKDGLHREQSTVSLEEFKSYLEKLGECFYFKANITLSGW